MSGHGCDLGHVAEQCRSLSPGGGALIGPNLLQRWCGLSYAHAAQLRDDLVALGVLTAPAANGLSEVLPVPPDALGHVWASGDSLGFPGREVCRRCGFFRGGAASQRECRRVSVRPREAQP